MAMFVFATKELIGSIVMKYPTISRSVPVKRLIRLPVKMYFI